MAAAGTRDRGYGREHRNLREQYRPAVEAGEVLCARCLRLIEPGDAWDLGHDDVDRSIYTGPEHARCNRRAGGRRGGRATARVRRVRVWSRQWLDD